MMNNENFSDSDSDTEEQSEICDTFTTLPERFDQYKLYTILQNQKEIEKQMRPITDPTVLTNRLRYIQRYLDNSQDGVASHSAHGSNVFAGGVCAASSSVFIRIVTSSA